MSPQAIRGQAAPADSAPADRVPADADPAVRHVAALVPALEALAAESARLHRWAALLAARLSVGGRLLAAGNGGSAAEAQPLTAELVGRFSDDRRP
ncbi:MAG: SIS domain-containing protein, partial [Actinobacteria bacterium]|nr:SIS domain-containing protein [Actinomycetota bacterium]